MSAPADDDQALFSVSWGGGWDPIDYTTPLFHSDQGVPDGFNINHYSNESVDELLEEGVATVDEAERVATYDTLQSRLLEDVPVSVIRFGEEYHVWDTDDVSDWETYPLPAEAFRPIYDPASDISTDVSTAADELIVDLPSAILAFDPTRMEGTTSMRATALLYEPLVQKDVDGQTRPALAESWEYLDETTLRFTLRDGVPFHNGETLSPENVIGTLERYSGTVRDLVVFDWYDTGTVLDDRTIELSLTRPYGPLEARLSSIPIVPQAVINGEHDLADEPVGTGPFQFGEHRPDTLFRLERFADHWFEGSEAVPATAPIETLAFRIIVDSSARQAALEAGDTHLSTALPAESLPEFESNERYGTDRATTGGFEFLVYPLYTEPFSSRKVRRGCDRLMPRADIIETVYQNIGRGRVHADLAATRAVLIDGQTTGPRRGARRDRLRPCHSVATCSDES
ncbi:MAG: ABC transporter substrate-binding protein [Natrialbaceae archaeon]|nr:ABC transporter substrate-binding protein [Natrialbaceae archaeon]